MHRPDHSTKDPDHDGLGHAGYTEGNPGLAIPRTVVTKDQANEFSEGLARLVESAGITLVKNNFDQITQAVRKVGAPGSQVQNLFINGSFDIWQLGVSFFTGSGTSVSDAGRYMPDQWYVRQGSYPSGIGSGTVSRTSLAVGLGAAPRSSVHGLRCVQSVASNVDPPFVAQRVDLLEELDGQKLTLQVRAKVASGTLSATPYMIQKFGSGGSTDVVTVGSAWTWDTTLKLYTCTFTVPSIAGKTVGADACTEFGWFFPISTTFTADMFAAQLEHGDAASDFISLSPEIELLRAQRFLYKTYDDDVNPGTTTPDGEITAENSGTDAAGLNVDFPVPMRVKPTIKWYSPATGTVDKVERAIGAGDRTVTSTVGTGKRRSGYPVTSSPGASVLAAAHLVADARIPL